jgi:hypothetical protein
MAIKITVGSGATAEEEVPKKPIARVELEIRQTLDGEYIISDHADIYVVISPEKQKILALPKDLTSEVVYGAQDRLFKFLFLKGMISNDSIQGGNVYGSMEAALLPSDGYNNINLSILNISKFIEEERPYFEFVEDYEEMDNDRFVDPDEEDSTELGEVPHKETKGSMRPGYSHGAYWQSYMLENKE